MKTIKSIVFAVIVIALTFGASCDCGESGSAQAATDPNTPPEKVVHENTYEDEWKFTQNGFTLEKLYDSYDVENRRYDGETNQSYLDFYKFNKGGMEYLVIKDYNDDNMEVVNVTKDSLICAQLASKTPVSGSTAESDHQKWYNDN